MTNEEAINILRNAAFLSTKTSFQSIEEAVRIAIKALEQPVAKDINVPYTDAISRQAAIDAADNIIERDTSGNNDVVKAMTAWKMYVEALPSAQPESAERNEESQQNVPNDDLISRKMAIEKFWHSKVEFRPTQIDEVMAILKEIPSAQQEETCDTCKHGYFGDNMCDYCRVGYPSNYERRTDEQTT